MSTLLTRDACEWAALARSEHGRPRAHALAGARHESSPVPAGLDASVRIDSSDAHAGGRLTLEQRLDSVWEGLQAGVAADCPVCQAELGPLAGAHVSSCGRCGSILS